jgi:N-acetylglucosamine kinase-like BadF-type ATPase
MMGGRKMHQMNPFMQHAIRHGQTLINETNRAASLSQSLVTACDEIIMSISSGNVQGAVNTAQNARMMAAQIAQSNQALNRTLNERIEMANFVMSRIQSRVNELFNALQSMRGVSGISYQPQIFTSASFQQPNMGVM